VNEILTAVLESDGVRIRMLRGTAGDSWLYAPGDIVYVSSEVARVWLAHGVAEAASADSSQEPRRVWPSRAA